MALATSSNFSSTVVTVDYFTSSRSFPQTVDRSLHSFPVFSAAMHSNTQVAAALAVIALAPLASAHGYVSGVVSGGQWYSGTSPEWTYHETKPETAGWYANNQDNGYVAPSSFAEADVICHKGATVGLGSIPVAAGDAVDLQWVRRFNVGRHAW